MSLPIFKPSISGGDGGSVGSSDRGGGSSFFGRSTVDTVAMFSGGSKPQENSPGTSRLGSVKESMSPGTLDMSPRADTNVISERQVKWDREAALADSKQAELFHTQWNLIREQISTFSRELVGIRMEMKTLKVIEGKVAENEMNILKNRELLTELSEEPKMRRDGDERLAAEFRETYKAITEALAQESKDRIAGDEEILRALANTRAMGEKETRDRQTAADEIAIKMQALADGLQKECLDREQGDTALRSQHQSHRQDLHNEKAHRDDESNNHKRALQSTENTVAQQLKDLRAALEEEAKQRHNADAALDKASGDLGKALEAEGDKRNQLREDIDKAMQDMGNALEQESRARAGDDDKIRQVLQRTNDQIEANTRENNMALAELADRLKALGEALGQEGKERALGDDTIKKELMRIVEAIEQDVKAESEQRKLGDDELARRFGDITRQLELALQQLRDAMQTGQGENKQLIDELGRQTRVALDEEAKIRKDGDNELSRQVAEERKVREDNVKALLDKFSELLQMEKAERASNVKEINDTHHALKQSLPPQFKAMQDGLEAEITERTRQVNTLEQSAEELFRDLRGMIEKEVEIRVQETTTIATEAKKAKEYHETHIKRTAEDLTGDLKKLKDVLEGAITALNMALEEEKKIRGDVDNKLAEGLKAEHDEAHAARQRLNKKMKAMFVEMGENMDK